MGWGGVQRASSVLLTFLVFKGLWFFRNRETMVEKEKKYFSWMGDPKVFS